MTFFGETWRGVQRFVQDIRINDDLSRYESEACAVHQNAASRRFDTTQLEREIDAIRRAVEEEVCAVYGERIHQLESSISKLRLSTNQARTRLEVFARDYRQELNQLHEKKASLLDAKKALLDQMTALQQERSVAKEELSRAYEDMQEANSLIDCWYKKSERTPWLFGNGGKRLPDRSLFGQSLGDLDGYKADRARAGNAIGTCKDALAKIVAKQSANKFLRNENKAASSVVLASIKSTMEERQRMRDLKEQGYRRHSLEAELFQHLQQESHLQNERNQLTNSMAELVEQLACRSGIEERKRALAELREMRAQFLTAFDSPEQRSVRQQAHRESWLKCRGAL